MKNYVEEDDINECGLLFKFVYGCWMNMHILLVLISLFFNFTSTFILNSEEQHKRCYELELENCFREAFLSAIHPPMLHKRDIPRFENTTKIITERASDSKKLVRQIQVCHDVRKFSSCFIHPGCSDQLTANIASVQYHMVFGKKLPLNVFLAYRGYGRELCDQQCSKDVVKVCQNNMKEDDQQKEQGYLLELSTIIGHITPNRDTTAACSRFNKVLINLMKLRKVHCGEISRCTCSETLVQQGVDGCNSGCEHLLHLDLDQMASRSWSKLYLISYVLVFLYLVLIVI